MLSGVGSAGHLREMGIDPKVDALRGRRRTCRTIPWCWRIYQGPPAPMGCTRSCGLTGWRRWRRQWALFGFGRPGQHAPCRCRGLRAARARAGGPRLPVPGQHRCRWRLSPWFPGWALKPRPSLHPRGAATSVHNGRAGEVTLRSADHADAPRIRHNLFQHEADKAFARQSSPSSASSFATEPAASLVAAELLPGPGAKTADEIDAYIRSTIQTGMPPVLHLRHGAFGDQRWWTAN